MAHFIQRYTDIYPDVAYTAEDGSTALLTVTNNPKVQAFNAQAPALADALEVLALQVFTHAESLTVSQLREAMVDYAEASDLRKSNKPALVDDYVGMMVEKRSEWEALKNLYFAARKVVRIAEEAQDKAEGFDLDATKARALENAAKHLENGWVADAVNDILDVTYWTYKQSGWGTVWEAVKTGADPEAVLHQVRDSSLAGVVQGVTGGNSTSSASNAEKATQTRATAEFVREASRLLGDLSYL